ncbi:Uncharacterised protein [Ectopseudomonas mendocina]|uniref:hypothetical protein n=1 Tax=Ectopseudomonas mendocina TaxID=300 RepID=UPI000DFD5DC9|nr:hypothetical protein [Pseudomonas mendocina]SUD65613.1 Uncharacterised protein [Pseudomonas mendocina]SUD65632.1 Uncharacterised protein [Pseudomonas mendocina]SUD65800.1 Uncharacterised protein [Pseudomonas mendocina]
MKYILILAMLIGGYYYYLKSSLLKHEGMINAVLSKQAEMCSHQGMLDYQKMTSAECNSQFTSSIERCVSALKSQYPGSKFSSKEEADAAGSSLANCLTGRK